MLADGKSAAAGPAERKSLAAAVALFCASSFFMFFYGLLHCKNALLLYIKK
jgi:hypothetical protein